MKHTQEELKAIVDARNATKAFQIEARQIVKDYTQEEIDTFPVQEEEAKSYIADNTSPTPMIDAIISESGEDKAELVSRIITKSNAFRASVGKALGKKRKSATG
jgi:hypothetical protein